MIHIPQLMLNRHKELLLETAPVYIEGLIGWELIRNGQVVRSSPPQRNLIVTAALNGMGNGTSITTQTTYCAVGSSSTAPASSDTSLVAQVDVRTNSNGGFADVFASGPSFAYWEKTITRLFTETQVNGNLTEVGFFSAAVAGTMFNRQLLKDNLGNPTTITKTNADQLKIILKIRVYPNTTIVNQPAVDISGVSTSIDNRAIDIDGSGWSTCNWGSWSTVFAGYENNAMPATTATQSGTNDGGVGTGTLQAYTNGNFYRDFQVVYTPAQTNFPTGYGSISWGAMGGAFTQFNFISTFTPKIAKTSSFRLTLMVRASWAVHP